MFTKLYFATLAIWNYFFSKKGEPPTSNTTINIILSSEPSKTPEPCMVEYDYNKY